MVSKWANKVACCASTVSFMMLSASISAPFISPVLASPDAETQAKAGILKPRPAESGEAMHQHQYNPNALHRVDFRVEGKSCAVCLHKMQEKMKELPGTVKAAVMLYKPYGAVVIYDSTVLNVEKILDKAKEGVPDVRFEDVEDTAIKALPVILVPKVLTRTEDNPAANLP